MNQNPITIIKSPLLSSYDFNHGFSTRHGEDQILNSLGFSLSSLIGVNQIHGNTVVVDDGREKNPAHLPDADAIILFPSENAKICGVKTADCLPILFAHPKTRVVGAIHAGWRGIVSGVIFESLARIAHEKEIIAAIGPCIGACCFEVGNDVACAIEEASNNPLVRAKTIGEKAFIDLRLAARSQFLMRGILTNHIEDVGACTACHPELFFSYRRDRGVTGRHFSVISTRTA